MGGKFSEGLNKATAGVRKGLAQTKQALDKTATAIGGGVQKANKVRAENQAWQVAKADVKGAKTTAAITAESYQKAKNSSAKLIERSKKYKNPNSTQNQARLKKAAEQEKKAETNSITAAQKLRTKTQALSHVKEQATVDALRQVRNSGYKRLGTLGALGALGLGSYAAYNVPGQPDSKSPTQTTSQIYRFDPKNRWQKNVNGKWVPQQKEFGVDRNGNTNYYDGRNWVSDYIQGSDGTIYNRQGQVIGSIGDPTAMRASGYDNIFDYNASKVLGPNVTPEQVAVIQQHLGVDADGKWGARTQAAYDAYMRRYGQL